MKDERVRIKIRPEIPSFYRTLIGRMERIDSGFGVWMLGFGFVFERSYSSSFLTLFDWLIH